MQPVHVTLDDQAIATGRDLVHRYGPGASLSAVVRRALSLLNEVWEQFEYREDEVAMAEEHETFAQFAGVSQRQPPKAGSDVGVDYEPFGLAAAMSEIDPDDVLLEF